MASNSSISDDQDQLAWPEEPSGILIMGKRQGTKKENKQLWGRVALAAALWYSAPQPKPYLIFVALDFHGPHRTPDAVAVKSMLIDDFNIPADFIIIRQKTNCTLLEVRAARVLSKVYGITRLFVTTHLYHAPRTQRYVSEVLPDASVIPVHPEILQEISFPAEAEDLLVQIENSVQNSLPGRVDSMREHVIEWLLGVAHTIDPRGHFERSLARLLRPGTY